MRNLKKFLALVMAMVMAFSLMVTANAATTGPQFDDAKDVTPAFEEAVDVLVGMKVFQGDEGGFRPASNITRAEVAVLIYRLATGDTGIEKVELYNTQHPFTDVKADDWFAGYVGYCWNAGYIKGTTKTTFNPYAQVTGYEVLAMILRAVGYDKNDEFTGGDWIVKVSATAQQRGILKDVKSTHYGNTLHLASRRDVVASLLFNAAIVPQVVYTPAFGYQTTGMNNSTLVNPVGGRENDTLGYQNFGLEVNHGIIVANQETGNSNTVIGVTKKDGSHDYNGNDAKPRYADELNADNTVKTALVTVPLKLETGLKEYGHEFRVWFNADDSGAKTVYAYYDKVNKTKLVVAANDSDVMTTNRAEQKLGNIAEAAGFTSVKDVYVSPAFDGFSGLINATGDHTLGAFDSEQNLYVLIANGSNTDLDAVISLNVNSTKINWVDNNALQKTVTIDTLPTNVTDKYVGTAGGPASNTQNATLESKTVGAGNDIVIYQEDLTANSVKGLNDYVVANAIGMMNAHAVSTLPGYTVTGYNLQKPTTKVGHVISYKTDAVGNAAAVPATDAIAYQRSLNPDYVVLDDGTQIKKSPLYYTVDGYHTANPEIPQVWVDMNNDNVADTEAYTARSYRFYLDSNGDYIGAEPIFGETFIYGTYADYSQATSTSTFKYYLTGVNMNGEVVTEEFTHFNNNGMITQNLGALDVYYHNFNQVGDSQNITGIGGTQYKGFVLNNRDLTDGAYVAGGARATTMSPADIGVTTSILNGANDPGTEQAEIADWAAETGVLANTTSGVTTIGKRDAAVGAVEAFRVGTLGYFLTNNTKFIVVSGYGTDTVKPTVYNGIGDLLGSSREVRINAASFASQFAFTTSDYYYAHDGVYSKQIDTIFLPARAVTGIDDGSAFFLSTETPVMYNAIGSNVAKYTMYLDGERQDTWINNFYQSDGTTIETPNNKVHKFFELRATSSTAHDGETIYNAYEIAENRLASYGIINPCQDDGTVAKSIPYSAATRDATVATINGVLYNVSNAKVINLIPANTPAGYDLTYVNSVPELNDLSTIAAQLTGVTGDVAHVYAIQTEANSAVVSAIYVVGLGAPTVITH